MAVLYPWLRARPQMLWQHVARRRVHARIVANVAWLVGDKIVRMGLGVLIGAWIARYLGPANFGELSFALALVALVGGVATAGLPDILIRELVRMPDRRSTIMASALAMRLLGGLATLALATAAMAVLRPGDGDALVLVAVLAGGPLAQAMDVIDTRYQASNDVRVIILLRNAAFIVVSLLRVAAILLKAPLPVFAALSTFEVVLAGALMWWCARFDGRDFDPRDVELGECRRLLGESWPLLIRVIAISVYLRIDQVMIGRLLDTRSVGLYAAAARISEIWYLVPTAVMVALVPKLAESHQRSYPAYAAQLTVVMRTLVWASIGFAGVMTFAAGPAMAMLYGPGFGAAGPVLALHAWAAVAVTMGVVSTSWFINMGLTRYGLYQALIGAATSIVGNFYLIPVFGIGGAAATVVLCQFVSAVMFNAGFAATRPIFWIQMRALLLLPPRVPRR